MIDWNSSGRLFHSFWPLKVNARWPAAVLQSGICRRSLFLVLQLCTSDLVLNFWQRYGGASLISDHPKSEDLVVVAYKKLLPRDPFQEEVLIHPLFDIEFVAFTFQVQYCVIRVTYDRCLHIEVDCNVTLLWRTPTHVANQQFHVVLRSRPLRKETLYDGHRLTWWQNPSCHWGPATEKNHILSVDFNVLLNNRNSCLSRLLFPG